MVDIIICQLYLQISHCLEQKLWKGQGRWREMLSFLRQWVGECTSLFFSRIRYPSVQISNVFFYSFSKHSPVFLGWIKSHIASQDMTLQISLGIPLISTIKINRKEWRKTPKDIFKCGISYCEGEEKFLYLLCTHQHVLWNIIDVLDKFPSIASALLKYPLAQHCTSKFSGTADSIFLLGLSKKWPAKISLHIFPKVLMPIFSLFRK